MVTELEWPIKPLLEEWAEVATFDAPGVGAEAPVEGFEPTAIANRGLKELDARGWDRCVVVADEFGAMAAVRLMTMRSEAVEGFALGHACLENRIEGERPTLDAEIWAAMGNLFNGSYPTFLRSYAQTTKGAYGDEFVEAYLERVPRQLLGHFLAEEKPPSEPLEEPLRELGIPMLFAEHEGCLAHTPEGYEDAVAAFPDAHRATMAVKPSTSPEFAEALREFCAAVEAG